MTSSLPLRLLQLMAPSKKLRTTSQNQGSSSNFKSLCKVWQLRKKLDVWCSQTYGSMEKRYKHCESESSFRNKVENTTDVYSVIDSCPFSWWPSSNYCLELGVYDLKRCCFNDVLFSPQLSASYWCTYWSDTDYISCRRALLLFLWVSACWWFYNKSSSNNYHFFSTAYCQEPWDVVHTWSHLILTLTCHERVLIPFYRRGHCGSERGHDLLKVTWTPLCTARRTFLLLEHIEVHWPLLLGYADTQLN